MPARGTTEGAMANIRMARDVVTWTRDQPVQVHDPALASMTIHFLIADVGLAATGVAAIASRRAHPEIAPDEGLVRYAG